MAQVEAGAQMLQVFDSWAGLLAPEVFGVYARPYLAEIAERVKAAHPEVPMTVFAKGAHYALDDLAETAYDVIGLDWTHDPAAARRIVGERAALQGNLDPTVLYAEPETIYSEVERMLGGFGPTGHIANLGHGMQPDHDPEHAGAFVHAVREVSQALRTSHA